MDDQQVQPRNWTKNAEYLPDLIRLAPELSVKRIISVPFGGAALRSGQEKKLADGLK